MIDEYDAFFAQANKEFFGRVFDWHWWKAQGKAESDLDPKAKSHCGAMGIMQIMPATWEEIASEINIADPWKAEQSIRAGVYYMLKIWRFWVARGIADPDECLRFSQASYNAGMGNIRKAWRLSPTDKWKSVASHLHRITGEDNSQQTINYVKRIADIFGKL